MKLSCYGYLFNATKREFDLDGMVANFTAFFDETVIATIPSEDDTYERLKAHESTLGSDRFKVIMTDIQLSNNRFDGDLKTAALQACTKSTPESPRVFIIADADERFPLSNKLKWVNAAYQLPRMIEDGFFIPVLDLYGSDKQIRADQDIGNKFRMHGPSIVKRGVIPGAEYSDGRFNTALSDSTEPLDAYGQLGHFAHIVDNRRLFNPLCVGALIDFPYVLHYGHLDVARRIKLNKEFWREHWENRSGHPENLASNEDELRHIPLVEHGLPLT